jgi:hypothetical protein
MSWKEQACAEILSHAWARRSFQRGDDEYEHEDDAVFNLSSLLGQRPLLPSLPLLHPPSSSSSSPAPLDEETALNALLLRYKTVLLCELSAPRWTRLQGT